MSKKIGKAPKLKDKIKSLNKNSKQFILFIGTGIFLLLILLVVQISQSQPSYSYKIAREIAKSLNNAKVVTFSKDDEFDYSYYKGATISLLLPSSQTDAESNQDIQNFENSDIVIIEEYYSKVEAEAKLKYIQDYYKLIHDDTDNTFLKNSEEISNLLIQENDLVFSIENYIFRIKSNYSERFEEIKSLINNVMQKYKSNDEEANKEEVDTYWATQLTNTSNSLKDLYNKKVEETKNTILDYLKELEGCEGTDCDDVLNKALDYKEYTEFSDEINSVQNKYDEIINSKKEVVKEIDNLVSSAEGKLNKNDYDTAKSKIDSLSDSFYDSYKKEWNSRLESVQEKIYKNDCQQYSYSDVLRNSSDYIGKKAYWFGVIQQKVDSLNYRIGVNCSPNRFADSGYVCDDTIYVTYFGDESLIEDDVVEMWGTMMGTKTYTAIFGNTITIPAFTAMYLNRK